MLIGKCLTWRTSLSIVFAVLLAIPVFTWPGRVQAEDEQVQIKLDPPVIYKGEQCTLTFSYADGRPVDESKIYLPNGEIRRAGGNQLVISWSDFADPATGVVPKTNPGVMVQIKVGGKYRSKELILELANVTRPVDDEQPGQPEAGPDPAAWIAAVTPEGDQGTLTYRLTADVDTDGCTLTGIDWYIGGGTASISTEFSALHTFPAYGDYLITLEAEFTDGEGQKYHRRDSGTYRIGEDEPPTAKIYIKSAAQPATWAGDHAEGGAPLVATFTGEFSSDPEGLPLTEYHWFMNGGAEPVVTTTAEYTHTFKEVGIYYPTLVVVDDWGNESTMSAPVTVKVGVQEPQLIHTHNAQGTPPDTVDFIVRSPYEVEATSQSFNWDFGDGSGRVVGATPAISHTYAKLARYTVSVECRYDYADGSYVKSTLTKTFSCAGPARAVLSARPLITVPGVPAPSLDALPPGTQVVFSATGSQSPYGKITSYAFDINGDGRYEHDLQYPDITVTASLPGTYSARCRITDERGNQAEATVAYTVVTGLVASLDVTPALGLAPLGVTCDASGSTNAGVAVESYEWTIADETGLSTTDVTQGAQINVEFPETGTYTVTLTVLDSQGNRSPSVSRSVVVGESPQLTITHQQTVYVGNVVEFDASGSFSPNGSIAQYEWDLYGSGYSSELNKAKVSRVFDQAGTYTIRLRVTDDPGFMGTVSVQVTVQDVPAQPESSIPWGTKVL